MKLPLAVCLAGLVTGCAYVGNPMPPTLDIPARVTDLRAAEFGDTILVQFTLPALTTEGLALTSVRAVEAQAAAGAEHKAYEIAPKGAGAYSYQFAAQDWVGKQVALTVRATGPKGQTSEWSAAFALAVKPPLTTPGGMQAVSVPQGVRLTWQANAPSYRIFRGAGETMPSPLAESDKAEFVDTTADFDAPYKYFVQAMNGALYMSAVSQTVSIVPHDIFPPGVPAGVTGVASAGAIELAWERNTEEDFAAYNLYRSTDGGAFERVAGPLDAPTFSDRAVEAGKKYNYAVTSLDKTGNQSARSTPVEVTAQ